MAQVVGYVNDGRRCFCQIKFKSGERVLVSIATLPEPSVKIIRLVLWGLIPRQTLWEYSETQAGGLEGYLKNMQRMFSASQKGHAHFLDAIRDNLLGCKSLGEAVRKLYGQQQGL